MKKRWKDETARDLLALGSWVFYILVIGRALIKPYRPFVDEIIIAGVVVVLAGMMFLEFDGYIARALVLVIFTSMFYENVIYTSFASIVGLLMLFSSYGLNKDIRRIGLGLIVGIFALICGYYWALFISNV